MALYVQSQLSKLDVATLIPILCGLITRDAKVVEPKKLCEVRVGCRGYFGNKGVVFAFV